MGRSPGEVLGTSSSGAFGWVCALLLIAAGAQAQISLPADSSLFSDDLVRRIRDAEGFQIQPDPVEPRTDPATRDPETLFFQDGRQLRGAVVSLSAAEIVWQRSDVSEPLRFPHEEVRRIVRDLPASQAAVPTLIADVPGGPEARKQDSTPGSATMKLAGSDWLHGVFSSEDGRSFSLRLHEQTVLSVPRTSVEWLQFGNRPAPVCGFSPDELGAENWLAHSPGARAEAANGVTTILGTEWIGRAMALPERFEVSLVLPAAAEEDTQLWLQPHGPDVNSYTTGTVELSFGREQLRRCIYIDDLKHEQSPLPAGAAREKGPARYRIYYDGVGGQLIVLRNGQTLGAWNLAPEKKEEAAPGEVARRPPISAICLQRSASGKREFRFREFKVRPWNGVIPKEDASSEHEVFSASGKDPVSGRLEALSPSEVIFSGTATKPDAGAFIAFPSKPAPLANADAALLLGRVGELSAAGLTIHDGIVRCDTAFASAVELPIAAMQGISFAQQPKPATAPPGDLLVFQNGDELPGALITAAHAGPIQWKTTSGQTVEIQPARVAGVRFAAGRDEKPLTKLAGVELRNGDKIRGQLASLDERTLSLQHSLLGMVALDRAQLATLSFEGGWDGLDGGTSPAAWMNPEPQGGPRKQRRIRRQADSERPAGSLPWLYLDGHYVRRGAGRNGSVFSSEADDATALLLRAAAGWDRFELRFDATNAGGGLPCFTTHLTPDDEGGMVQMSAYHGYFQWVVSSARAAHNHRWQHFELSKKLPEMRTRMSVRFFVDAQAGSAEMFIDGVPIASTGRTAADRIPGLGQTVRLSAQSPDGSPVVLSNIWFGPWSGDLPIEGAPRSFTTLGNGDMAEGAPLHLNGDTLTVESEIGPLAIPRDKVKAASFGTPPAPERAAGRVRLVDGCALRLETFRWEGGELVARSAALGDLRLPADAISELIFRPAPVAAPAPVSRKAPARKTVADADENLAEANDEQP